MSPTRQPRSEHATSAVGPQRFNFHRFDARYRHALGPGTLELGATIGVDGFGFPVENNLKDKSNKA